MDEHVAASLAALEQARRVADAQGADAVLVLPADQAQALAGQILQVSIDVRPEEQASAPPQRSRATFIVPSRF